MITAKDGIWDSDTSSQYGETTENANIFPWHNTSARAELRVLRLS